LDAWSILLQNKTDKDKIYSLHEPHVRAFPKAKPINLTNSGPRSRSPEPVTAGLFSEPWRWLEIPTMDIPLKPPLSKSKESQDNSRKSWLPTEATGVKRNWVKPGCWLLLLLWNQTLNTINVDKEKDPVNVLGWKRPSNTWTALPDGKMLLKGRIRQSDQCHPGCYRL